MKKVLFLLAAAMFACSVQTAFAQISWWDATKSAEGITLRASAGFNLSHFTHVERWSRVKPGANVGVMAEMPLLNSLSAKAGLFYTMKGAVGKNDAGFGGILTTTFSPSYLELPVMASYRFKLNDNIMLQFDFGPYFAVGLHGKDVKKNSGNGSFSLPTEIEYKLFGKEGQLKACDFGFRFGPEIVFRNRLAVGLAYEVSAVSINRTMGSGKIGNGNFMINVSYPFYTF
ncbi:MAG: PorT family protein [Bacteroidales bacterium]|nr:PorT family protein [Bacteroidales bacterium]